MMPSAWLPWTGSIVCATVFAVPSLTSIDLRFQAPAAPARTAAIQGVVTTGAKAGRPIRISFDQKVCGTELPDGAVQVDAAGHLANAVVTLVGVKAAAPARTIAVVNDRCAFVPRVQVAGTGGTVKTSSRDPVLHTTVLQQPDGRQLFNVALPVPGMEIARPLSGTGVLRVACSTHQWMRGWILVTDDVAAVTGADGRFTLPDVPPGTYQLRVWHEALKATDRTITVAPGKPVMLKIEVK
jgi:plastocyanin